MIKHVATVLVLKSEQLNVRVCIENVRHIDDLTVHTRCQMGARTDLCRTSSIKDGQRCIKTHFFFCKFY